MTTTTTTATPKYSNVGAGAIVLRSPLATLIVLCSALLAQLPRAPDVFRMIVAGTGWPAIIHGFTYAVALELAVLLFVVQHRNVESYIFAAVSIPRQPVLLLPAWRCVAQCCGAAGVAGVNCAAGGHCSVFASDCGRNGTRRIADCNGPATPTAAAGNSGAKPQESATTSNVSSEAVPLIRGVLWAQRRRSGNCSRRQARRRIAKTARHARTSVAQGRQDEQYGMTDRHLRTC